MLELLFKVKGAFLTTSTKSINIPADTLNYVKCNFTFDTEWEGTYKTAYFKNSNLDEVYQQFIDSNGDCIIPWESLILPGELHINVKGVKFNTDTVTYQLTTDSVVFSVQNDSMTDALPSRKPSPTEFEQFLIALQNNLTDIESTQYTTPEYYGARGDGVFDDAPAFQAALNSGKRVRLTSDLHLFSNVSVSDKDIFLDGQGYTVYIHGQNMVGNTANGDAGGQCIAFSVSIREGDDINADVKLYTESNTYVMNPAFPEENTYHRGYLSYHGFNPTPDKEIYEDYRLYSWKEYSADIRNCRFIGDSTDGLTYLRFDRYCHSIVDNCDFICKTEDGAAIGLRCLACYDFTISRVYADNFTANTSRSVVHTGYGIQVTGDAIIIQNCILKNCKNHINIGGASGDMGFFTTGTILDSVVLQTTDTGEYCLNSNHKLYQQMLDLHEGCHNPIINNVSLEYENAMGADNYGTLIHLSCPEATITNLRCKFTKAYGDWAVGYIGFGPLAKHMYFSNIHAPGCHLFAHGWGFERGNSYDANYIRTIQIEGGELGGILSGHNQGLVTIRLSGVRVNGLVDCSTLWANNCVFHNLDRKNNGPQIIISNEAFFTNCDIYGYTLGNYKKRRPVIMAPKDKLYITGCVIRKPLDELLFNTDQAHLENVAVWDLFGLVLGSRITDTYADGDSCTLDYYNLW